MSAPPFIGVTGIYTVDDKHQEVSKADYDGHAKPGQLIVDTSDYTLWIGTPSGYMVPSSTAVGGPVANAIFAVTSGAANSVAGANVSGAVALATTANAVAGANVSGQVADAASADVALSVAGANVSGIVALATEAYSVAAANVVGTVANATFATSAGSADSVAGANVVGIVSLAAAIDAAGAADILIGGGALDEILKSDGVGGMVWAQSDIPSGANTEIQFNNDGVFGSDANLVYDNTSQTLTVTGTVATDTALAGNSFVQFTSIATSYVEVAEMVTTNQIDITKGNFFAVDVTGPITLDVINYVVGPGPFVASFVLEIKDGGTNVTWWPNIIWAGGATPVLTTTGTDVLAFYSVAGTDWRGFVLALDMK